MKLIEASLDVEDSRKGKIMTSQERDNGTFSRSVQAPSDGLARLFESCMEQLQV